jgi:hypothetical protein
VDKPLPTFQLYGSIITTSFHIAELGVMSQFIFYTFLINILVNKPYFLKVILVVESLEHPSMVRTDRGSNPAASHLFFYFLFFSIFCFFMVRFAPGRGLAS